MPTRRLVARELGALLKLLSHPDRILILHLLSETTDYSVTDIAEELSLPPARVSQHLSALRSFKLVEEKSSGRQRFYSPTIASLPDWLLQGVDYVADRVSSITPEQAERAKRAWRDHSAFPRE
ncbi:MAG: metalloregulator ArsR/SmtB family transcription factor [Pseudomonadota bacterium]